MQAAEASVVPLVQGPPLLRESARETEVYPISSDDTSRAREVVGAEETDAMEQPVPLLDEGGSTLVRVRPEPRGWDHPRVLWRSRDDPEGEPLFALEDTAEGGRWSTFEQYRELAERSLRTALSVVADELPGVAQVRALLSRATLFFPWFCRNRRPLLCLLRSLRPGPSGSWSSSSGRGESGTSFRGRGAFLPMLTSFCRPEARRWRTSAFAVPMRRSRRPQPRRSSPPWRRGSRSWRRSLPAPSVIGMPSDPGLKKRRPRARPSLGSWGQRRVRTG